MKYIPFTKKPKEPEKPLKEPYLPRAVELTVDQHKPEEGLKLLLSGFADYFSRTAEALGPYPQGDTAMLIALYTHIAASLSYQDPAAAQMAEQIEKVVKLPPVDFRAVCKK